MKKLKMLASVIVAALVVTAPLLPQPIVVNKVFTITVRRGATELGEIKFKLLPEVAPKHCAFVEQRIAEGFYNGSAFHRVIPNFMIQGGDPNSISGPKNTWGTGGYKESVVAEFNAKKHVRGVISAARTNDPNSFRGQFFICVTAYPSLDGLYSAFGEVISGMDVADAIVNSPRDGNNNPLEKITMNIELTEITHVSEQVFVLKGVSPVPANTEVTIGLPDGTNVNGVTVLSVAGAALSDVPYIVTGTNIVVNTSGLQSGMYQVMINTTTGLKSSRVVVMGSVQILVEISRGFTTLRFTKKF
ncbi:MAG: peptidylprolyl isomerase [Ignavibacteria bacterium]|nr:peptidylprolyl isomerase [Ignavibacteria bacterium]